MMATTTAFKRHYHDIIVNINESMDSRFHDLTTSPVFKHLQQILDVHSWPVDEMNLFGEAVIIDLEDCFEQLLLKNKCNMDSLIPEWLALKTHMIPVVKNNPKEHYINIGQRIFNSEAIKEDCKNIMHVIEILLCHTI